MDKATRQCEWCGDAFTPRRRDQRVCGPECRRLYYNSRERKRVPTGPLAHRECRWCGTRYSPRRVDQRTCGSKCRTLLNRKEQNARLSAVALERRGKVRLCGVCSEEFSPPRSDSRHCSRRCQEHARLEKSKAIYVPTRYRRPAHICCWCGTEFRPVRSDARYCSVECSGQASYSRSRAERVAYAVEWNRAHRDRRTAISNNYKSRRRTTVAEGPGVRSRDWQRIIVRHGGRCAYCGSGGDLQMDHVVPLVRGGSHSIGNVLPACAKCNLSKHASLLSEWRLRKKREVMQP